MADDLYHYRCYGKRKRLQRFDHQYYLQHDVENDIVNDGVSKEKKKLFPPERPLYLQGTPAESENADDDEDEPGDPSPTASALGADARAAPQFDQHGHVEDTYQDEGQDVARQEEGYLERGPVILIQQDPAGRLIRRRAVRLLEHVANLRMRDASENRRLRIHRTGVPGRRSRRAYLAVDHKRGRGQ